MILVCITASLTLSAQLSNETNVTEAGTKIRLKVFYFHLTDRCNTCYVIEEKIRETIEEFFSEEVEQGTIELHILNCDLPVNREAAKKFNAFGSTLILLPYLNGNEYIPEDLSEWAYDEVINSMDFLTDFKGKIEEYLKR